VREHAVRGTEGADQRRRSGAMKRRIAIVVNITIPPSVLVRADRVIQ
jgi:hypothetical protein